MRPRRPGAGGGGDGGAAPLPLPLPSAAGLGRQRRKALLHAGDGGLGPDRGGRGERGRVEEEEAGGARSRDLKKKGRAKL